MSWFSELIISFGPVLPELILLCFSLFILVFDAFLPRSGEHKNYNITFWLVNLVLLIVIYLVFWQVSLQPFSTAIISLENTVRHDKLSVFLKIWMAVFVLFSFCYSKNYLKTHKIAAAEYYVMGLFSLLGMMVLVSASHMISLYLGLELFSLPVYAMVAMQTDSTDAGESALKYFVMGAIASGILLFGVSIIYGMTGSLVISEIASYTNSPNSAFILGLVFICAGIAFKFGAAPFHMWMPDLYQGAPTPATLFVATAPKLAAFGMAIRLLHDGFNNTHSNWAYIFLLIGVLSVAWGNLGALSQVKFKRLLGYSGISHMGFVLLAFIAASVNSEQAYAAGLYYIMVYSLTSMAAFGFILMYGNSVLELTTLDDYKGLYYKQPWLALMLLMVLFSMAGVPPFVGFFAKFAVIQSLLMAGYYYTSVFIALMSVVGAFYYLKMIWLMFFEQPEKSLDALINQGSNLIAPNMKILVSINCLLMLVFGLYTQGLFNFCQLVFK